jgi:leucyl aminopeptidase
MEIRLQNTSPEKAAVGVLAVGAFANGSLTDAGKALDKASGGHLSAVLKRGDLEKKVGASLVLHDVPGVAAERVLLVSLGDRGEFSEQAFRAALAAAGKAFASGVASDAAVALSAGLRGRSTAWRVQQAARVLADAAYRFDVPSATTKETGAARGARSVTLLLSEKADAKVEVALKRGLAIAEGMALAKDLGNLGGNVCNPTYLAQIAEALGKEFKFKVDVLERKDMEKLGMGSLLSVGRASYSPCKLIVMHYKGGKAADKPVVLVGKGITFDTGGVSLKPGANLDEMKFDMSGAGAVIGVMKTVARMKLRLNVIGVVPAAENMPGGNASRPGDVVTSMSGQTIEILNTDAEGRLILCDALTYSERFNPACVIDIATLTGACVIALGQHAGGLFANDDKLADELLKSGTETGDRAWRMPLWEDYMGQLKSNFADMSNLGGPPAGSITGALFLSRFAKAFKWAHLDIAGTASVSGDAKGSTGRPVPLLAEFLMTRAGK